MSVKGPLYRKLGCASNPNTGQEMGAEHSDNPRELTDPVECWERHGFRINTTVPTVPAKSKIRMLEDMKVTVIVECKKPVPLRTLSAFCWTNSYHKDNPEGIYQVIPMQYVPNSRSWDDWGVTTYKFSTNFFPTHNDDCRMTFYAKLDNIILWANRPEIDHVLEVLPPRDVNQWTKAVSHTQITKNLHLGNYPAARKAAEFGYDVIVRFCDKVPKKQKEKEGEVPQLFHTFNKDSGAGSEIPADRLLDTVEWLENCKENYQKILIADEYGLGRVGSAMTAYIFAHNPHLTFDEAYKYVQRRREIYCHRGLNDTLHVLFPRE